MSYKVPILGWSTPPLTHNKMPRNHMALYRIQQDIKSRTVAACHALRAPKGLIRANVILHYCPRTNQARMDEDGLSPTLKPALDGLVAYGMFADDDHRIVHSGHKIEAFQTLTPVHFFGMGGSRPSRLWLTVEDLSPVVSGDRPTNPPDRAA